MELSYIYLMAVTETSTPRKKHGPYYFASIEAAKASFSNTVNAAPIHWHENATTFQIVGQVYNSKGETLVEAAISVEPLEEGEITIPLNTPIDSKSL